MGRKKTALAAAAVAAVVLGIILTHDKARCANAPVIHSRPRLISNIGCEQPELNPLREAEYQEMVSLIRSYYEDKQKELDFVERYDDIQLYTKVGEYRDTYVAFAVYRMKIKDQYTEVPGLETFRIIREKGEKKYRIEEGQAAGLSDEYIQRLMSHEDVKQMFADTAQAYQETIKEDALLAEALEDLKTAYAE